MEGGQAKPRARYVRADGGGEAGGGWEVASWPTLLAIVLGLALGLAGTITGSWAVHRALTHDANDRAWVADYVQVYTKFYAGIVEFRNSQPCQALKNNNTTPDRPTACDDISIVAEAFLNANADWMNSDGLTSIDSNGWTWAMAGARKPALDEPVNYEVIYVSDGGYDYYIVTSELSINLGVVDTKIDYSDADFMNLLNMYNGAALVSVAKKFNILDTKQFPVNNCTATIIEKTSSGEQTYAMIEVENAVVRRRIGPRRQSRAALLSVACENRQ